MLGLALFIALSISVVGVSADHVLMIGGFNNPPAGDHNTAVSGDFTIDNSGNDPITNIFFDATALTGPGIDIPSSRITFNPDSVASLASGDQDLIGFSISIPKFQAPGTYVGTITAEGTIDEGTGGEQDSDDFVVTLTVNSNPSFTVNPDPLELEEEREKSVSKFITIQNTGNTDLTFSESDFSVDDPTKFSDGDENITISFSSTGFNNPVSPGISITVTVQADIPNDIFLDTYSGSVTVDSGVASDTFTLRIDIRPEEVGDICEDGRVGLDQLNIGDVRDPDDGDKFKPLEEIEVRVRVNNEDDDDMDVEFTAFLIDREDDDVLDDVESIASIDEEDDQTFKEKLEVPADIEDESSTRYAVYVVANEEDDEDKRCDWSGPVKIKIDKDKNDAVVDEITVEDTLICGGFNELRARIINIGNNDQDNVFIKLFIPDLDITLTSSDFDLDDDGDDKTISFVLDILDNIKSRVYSGRIEVRDEDGAIFTKSDESIKGFEINVECEAPKVAASLILSQTSFTSRVDSSVTTVVTITNTGDNEQSFTLRVTPIGTWTDPSETVFTLAAGDSRSEVLTLAVRQEGSHTAKIEVLADGNVVSTQTISVVVSSPLVAGQREGGITAQVISARNFREQLPLLIIIAVLAIAIIALIIWLVAVKASVNRGARATST